MEMKKPRTLLQWLRIRRCYLEAFPAGERKPFSVIVKMARQGRGDVLYWVEKGEFIAFATAIHGDGLVLLDYFAVDKGRRGRGFGTRALKQLQSLYADRGLFVEIERVCQEAPNARQRERRKEFYIQCGMAPLGVQAEVFGVEMELLGSRCAMTFDGYHSFYRDYNSPWAAEHIKPI